MLFLLVVLFVSSELCLSQMVYSRMVPHDPRFVLHRPPVRRSAMEALERLRLPVARYFPQVDSQVPSVPYQVASLRLQNLPNYQLSAADYALQPEWTDDSFIQPIAETYEQVEPIGERLEEDNDYGNYEYDNSFSPVYKPSAYAEEVYAPQEPVAEPETVDNAYNDFMVNYFLGRQDPVDNLAQQEQFDLQRRSEVPVRNSKTQGVITLSSVLDANKNTNTNETMPTPPAPVPSQVAPQVQMTAVPSSPEKKEMKSLVIPAPVVEPRDEIEDPWRAIGQKEEPLFRPMQNSQRTTWEVLTRAKNSAQKRPIPLLKKMIQTTQKKNVADPLTEELKSLKKEHKP